MKIQYCSDLHLEFALNNQFLKTHPLIPKGDVLILAGDILPFEFQKTHSSFIDDVSDKFDLVFWLPGNHEYYGYDTANKPFALKEKVRENVNLVNNVVIELEEVELIFSSLWSRISHEKENYIQQVVSDFFTISLNKRRLTPSDYNDLHDQCRIFIEVAIGQLTTKKRVIITHHVPTLHNYPEKYINSEINEAFVVELSDLIGRSFADYWVYGHHHCHVPEFIVGSTSLVTNQLGYVLHNEHLQFRRDAVLNIL